MPKSLPKSEPWWKTGVIYQVYPRSFQDSNGDGVGDLTGILKRLDHLAGLGIDAIWISPFYPSPMADFGYDVADYTDVDPLFGTLADFDALTAAVHERGLKLILDFVPNHTSLAHPWFKESRGAKEDPRRDWYIWRDPAPGGGPPNNWLAVFGGSAWEFDPQTDQYYYHAFLKEQPDLNWANPAVRKAMLQNMRFWLDRGVDGFRIDVIYHLAKDAGFRDEPPNARFQPGMEPYQALDHIYSCDQPQVHRYIEEMRNVIDEKDGRVLIGETYLPFDRLALYYGKTGAGVHLPFNFHLITTPFAPRAITRLIADYEKSLPPGAWPNWVLGNHDRSRIASRVGEPKARLAAMLLLSLRGTPTVYYGDELGLPDVIIPPALIHDPWEKNVPGLGLGRDPVRTPMPWDSSPHGEFTTGSPWLPLNPDWPTRNVAAESDTKGSMLNFYRRMLALRRAQSALQLGTWALLSVDDAHLAFSRAWGGRTLAIALNFEDRALALSVPPGNILLSTGLSREGERVSGRLPLEPYEGVVLDLI